jgi:NADH-quinone oxidoreductase subunit C
MAQEDSKPQETNLPKNPSETLVKKLPRRTAGAMPVVEIADDPLIKALKEKFGKNILSANEINSQQVLQVEKTALLAILLYLKDKAPVSFNMLTDLTAVHFSDQPEQPFEMVYQLYSIENKRRLRVKTRLIDGETIESVSKIWSTANWLEREVYDLFGIRFDEHPDLRRILLPNGWVGHPLRKEYPLEYKDNEWAAENLQIRELSADSDFTGKFE